ncbi:alpha/beta hydrolase [Nocardia sp. NPDC127526]|uniref:alpha/beta hydrolase n=1 Tax=Nocardia sp. NPDC127526 TaxID=3345393 RepID=UPI003644B023
MRNTVVALIIGVLALATGTTLPPRAAADPAERMDTGVATGLPYTVLLPTDYWKSDRRYPVLYLIQAGNGITSRAADPHAEWLERTDLAAFTEKQDVIVVLPTQAALSFYIDARDGSCRGESQFMDGLIPHIDATYRTLPDGRNRAVAGVAPGGLSAMLLAARHPGMFTAAASFSGEPDVLLGADRAGGVIYTAIERAAVLSCRGDLRGPGLFGPLPADEIWWRNSNPPDLAGNLRGLALYAKTGNGVPCDQEDLANLSVPQEGPFTQPFQLTEPVVAQGTRGLLRALDQAGIPYRGDVDGCGMHTWRYWQRQLHEFWPQLLAAFGTPEPETFDYRRADAEFSVRGWTFTADPDRAAEFLDIRSASRTGLTLTGSGLQSVITPGNYRPGAALRVDDGASVREVVADARGRLTFTVDLGPAHRLQQFVWGSDPQNAPNYFVTKTIRIG